MMPMIEVVGPSPLASEKEHSMNGYSGCCLCDSDIVISDIRFRPRRIT